MYKKRNTYFFYELKRSVLSKNMLFSLIFCFILLLIPFIYILFSKSIPLDQGANIIFQSVFTDEGNARLLIFLPILVCIPFSLSYSQELDSNILKYILKKISILEYSIIKLIIVSINAAIIVFLPLATVYILLLLIFGVGVNSYSSINFTLESLYMTNPILYTFIQILFVTLFGIFIALFCLLISTFIKNRMIALLTPFLIYIGLANINRVPFCFLHFQIVGDISLIPTMPIFPRLLYGLLLIIIFSISFIIILKKRREYV